METFLGGVGVLLVGGIGWLSYYKRPWYVANLQPGLVNSALIAFIIGLTEWFIANGLSGLTGTGAIKPEAIVLVGDLFESMKRTGEAGMLLAVCGATLLLIIRNIPPHEK